MKPHCPCAILMAGLLMAACAPDPKPAAPVSSASNAVIVAPPPQAPSASNPVIIASLLHDSLLETGQTYSAQVRLDATGGHTNWSVQNPPIPHHYAVGFDWLNLTNLSNPQDGTWTFLVKDIERWHDPGYGGPMGTYYATYKCEVLRIQGVKK